MQADALSAWRLAERSLTALFRASRTDVLRGKDFVYLCCVERLGAVAGTGLDELWAEICSRHDVLLQNN